MEIRAAQQDATSVEETTCQKFEVLGDYTMQEMEQCEFYGGQIQVVINGIRC